MKNEGEKKGGIKRNEKQRVRKMEKEKKKLKHTCWIRSYDQKSQQHQRLSAENTTKLQTWKEGASKEMENKG